MQLYKKTSNLLVAFIFLASPFVPALAVTSGLAAEQQMLQEREAQIKKTLEAERQSLEEKKMNLQQRQEDIRGKVQEKRTEIMGNMQERRVDMKENMQERQAAFQERLSIAKQRLISGQLERMMKRFDAALERYRQLGDRIQSRIEKAKANGKDTSKAEKALDGAKLLWQGARTAFDAARTQSGGILNAEDRRAMFQEMRLFMKTSQDKLRAAHRSLVEAIIILGGIGAGHDKNASSTPAS